MARIEFQSNMEMKGELKKQTMDVIIWQIMRVHNLGLEFINCRDFPNDHR